MIGFKEFLRENLDYLKSFGYVNLTESKLTLGGAPTGLTVMLGGSKISDEFATKVKDTSKEKIQEYDKFEVIDDPSSNISINPPEVYTIQMGTGDSEYFVKSHNSNKIYKLKGSESENSKLNKVFRYTMRRGVKGEQFEFKFIKDIHTYISYPPSTNIADMKDLQYSELIDGFVKEFQKNTKINLRTLGINDYKIIHQGNKNTRRKAKFNFNTGLDFKSDGKTLSDVTLIINNIEYYISLKTAKRNYLVSLSLKDYLEDDEKTRAKVYEYFGLDGQEMCNFGDIYCAETKKINKRTVIENLKKILKTAYGSGYYYVHSSDKHNFTFYVSDDIKITIKGSDLKYKYPVKNKRKYAQIDFTATVNGIKYKCLIQFRSSTGNDLNPRYLRIEMDLV